jgi:hypothetical protein
MPEFVALQADKYCEIHTFFVKQASWTIKS